MASPVGAFTEEAVHRLLARNPQAAITLCQMLTRMQDGSIPAAWLDVIVQKWEGRPGFTLGDAYCFALVWGAIQHGRIVTLDIEMGYQPKADREAAYHDGLLRSLAPPLAGCFHGGLQSGCDGWFGWTQPLEGGQTCAAGRVEVVMQPCRVPLEVGTTAAYRTYLHLTQERGLARWPYDSTTIKVLRVVDEAWPLLDNLTSPVAA